MKETHLFYAPNILESNELPAEESTHAIRVLRKKTGDLITIADGNGMFYEAAICEAHPKHCGVDIVRSFPDRKLWKGNIHVALAPTKHSDRVEWFIEKATEIGIDEITFLECDNSERRIIKNERLEKIAVAAMKQSQKAFVPRLRGMVPFRKFIVEQQSGQKFIAHCYNATSTEESENSIRHLSANNFLGDLTSHDGPTTVLIGPEGDFSLPEVELAEASGFLPVSLGPSRLRTETAALVAVHFMNIAKMHKDTTTCVL